MSIVENYAKAKEIFNSHFGSETIYKRAYCSSLNYTEGIMDFQQSLNAYWVVDNMVSYMPKIIKSFKDNEFDFFVVEITLNQKHEGYMEVFTEDYVKGEYQEHISIIKQDIPFIDLPTKIDDEITTYKFYLELSSIEPLIFTLLLPREH